MFLRRAAQLGMAISCLAGPGAVWLARGGAAESAPMRRSAPEAREDTPAVGAPNAANGSVEAGPALSKSGDADSSTLSGYTPRPTFEGPDGVEAELQTDNLKLGGVIPTPLISTTLSGWYSAKRWLNEEIGLRLGITYQALYQAASADVNENDASAGRFEFQGSWTLLGRKGENPSVVTFRFEDRHLLFNDIAPSQLGNPFGSETLVGTGFNDFGAALSELAWRQTLFDGALKFAFGKISAVSWYNGTQLSSPKTAFQNSALLSSNAKALPGRGFGFVTGMKLSDHFALVAGIHDANGKTTSNPFDTISEWEFMQSVELRWFPNGLDRRKWDQFRVQYWHQDERVESGMPSSQGVTFTASRLFNDFWMPFLYSGITDGHASLLEADVAVGVGFALNTAHRYARDVVSIATAWGRPSRSGLQDQYTTELFYRLQLVEHIAITPSLQLIVNPAANPSKEVVWVGGIRVRVTL